MSTSTKLKILVGKRLRVTTADGRQFTGWCRGLSAQDTRLVLDRVSYKSLIPVQSINTVVCERDRFAFAS